MAATTSRKTLVFCIHLILSHSVKFQDTGGVYFKRIEGSKMEQNIEDKSTLIHKEFYQCGREESCTHVIQLANNFMAVYGIGELELRKSSAVSIYEKMKIKGKFFSFRL